MCQDPLRTRELCQSPINVSATYDGKRSRNQFLQWFLLLTDVTLLQCQDPLRTRELCQLSIVGHCCNSGILRATSPRCFPYTTACQLTQPVVSNTARDMALELGPPSGTWKLILLLLDAGTSRWDCQTRHPQGFPASSHPQTPSSL